MLARDLSARALSATRNIMSRPTSDRAAAAFVTYAEAWEFHLPWRRISCRGLVHIMAAEIRKLPRASTSGASVAVQLLCRELAVFIE